MLMYYMKKPVIVEAHQWHQNGDHPHDNTKTIMDAETGIPFLSEGKIVRYYRHPENGGENKCKHCSDIMHVHGWIDTLEGGMIVCPGDYIITGVHGEHYPCKPNIFRKTYEQVSYEQVSYLEFKKQRRKE